MGQLYGIVAGAPFLKTLAQHLIDRYPDPLEMGRTWVILPTRRGIQELQNCLIQLKKNLILPRLLSLADLEAGDHLTPALPPVLAPLAQQGILMQLLLRQQTNFSMALGLSQELLKLFEEAETAEVDLSRLQTLEIDQPSQYWQQIAAFLTILTTHWPTILKEHAHITPAEHRQRVMADWCQRWQDNPPDFPIIMAGSTGTRPATARLIKTILNLPQSQVLLPAWDGSILKGLPPSHPSYATQQLVAFLGAQSVQSLGNERHSSFIRTLMQPAGVIPQWQVPSQPDIIPLTCATQNLEARTIALITQEAVQKQQKVCIVTPDQALTQHIAGELKRWGLTPEISQGIPLKKTSAGIFLQLTAALLENPIKPSQLLAVLKHPLCRFYQDPCVTELERQLRQDRAQILTQKHLNMIPTLVLATQESGTLMDLLIAHFQTVENLAGSFPDEFQVFQQALIAAAPYFPALSISDYESLLKRQLEQTTVPQSTSDGVHILGNLEARLFVADVVILAGLNEGTWPMNLPPDPWLTAMQRQKLGLPDLERKFGLAAHDFCMALSAPRIFITRAALINGEPTIPSRWYERLKALMPQEPQTDWYQKAERLDWPQQITSRERPLPSPPSSARPKRFSVSAIQRLMQDPYVYYAASILNLRPLPLLEKPLGAADWGMLVHRLLETGDLAQGAAMIHAIDCDPIQRQFWLQRWHQLKIWLEEHWHQSPFQKAWCEIAGQVKLGDYEITARADRLELIANNHYRLIDFKTGTVPSQRQVQQGFFPQLPLEGLILQAGGFSITVVSTISLEYWKLKGYGNPVAELTILPETLIPTAAEGTHRLLDHFREAPFQAATECAYPDYEPLIRRQEWDTA